MKKPISLILAAILSVAATTAVAQTAAQKYTCVMHPEVMLDQPGDCPKCGMALVVMEAEKKRLTPNLPPSGTGSTVASPTSDA